LNALSAGQFILLQAPIDTLSALDYAARVTYQPALSENIVLTGGVAIGLRRNGFATFMAAQLGFVCGS